MLRPTQLRRRPRRLPRQRQSLWVWELSCGLQHMDFSWMKNESILRFKDDVMFDDGMMMMLL